MNASVITGEIAVRRLYVAPDGASSRSNPDRGTNRVSPMLIDDTKHYPMAAVRDNIVEQPRRPVPFGDYDVDAAVIIQVAECRAPTRAHHQFRRTASRHDLFESPISRAAKEHIRLRIGISGQLFWPPRNSPIRLVQIQQAIVVEIEHRCSKARKRSAGRSQADGGGIVNEGSPLISKERIRFAFQVNNQEIESSRTAHIHSVSTHASLGATVKVDCAPGFERTILEATAALIQP